MITGSYDKTIRMYDIRKPSTISTLTYHKKSVRALAQHPREYAFASGGADNIKKFSLPEGEFLHNMLQVQSHACFVFVCFFRGKLTSNKFRSLLSSPCVLLRPI